MMCQHCRWNRTDRVRDRLGDSIDERGRFKGRHVITRDTKIDKGIYISSGPFSEAIVVDSTRDTGITKLYADVLKRSRRFGFFKPGMAIDAVYNAVAEAMPVANSGRVGETIEKYGIMPEQKVELGIFLEEGIGMCKHYALACGIALELLARDAYLRGNARINRSHNGKDGHAWARFNRSNAAATIVDVALGYRGLPSAGPWHYELPAARSR